MRANTPVVNELQPTGTAKPGVVHVNHPSSRPVISSVIYVKHCNYTETLINLPISNAGERIAIHKPVNTTKPQLNLETLE